MPEVAPPIALPPTTELEALERFVVDNDDLLALEERVGRFNLFDALGIARRELSHSNFLAWLLDPAESHGQGPLFLRAVLMDLLRQTPVEQSAVQPGRARRGRAARRRGAAGVAANRPAGQVRRTQVRDRRREQGRQRRALGPARAVSEDRRRRICLGAQRSADVRLPDQGRHRGVGRGLGALRLRRPAPRAIARKPHQSRGRRQRRGGVPRSLPAPTRTSIYE